MAKVKAFHGSGQKLSWLGPEPLGRTAGLAAAAAPGIMQRSSHAMSVCVCTSEGATKRTSAPTPSCPFVSLLLQNIDMGDSSMPHHLVDASAQQDATGQVDSPRMAAARRVSLVLPAAVQHVRYVCGCACSRTYC